MILSFSRQSRTPLLNLGLLQSRLLLQPCMMISRRGFRPQTLPLWMAQHRLQALGPRMQRILEQGWRTLAGEPLPLVGNLQLIQLWACRVACSVCSQAHCVRTFQQRSSSWRTEHLCRSCQPSFGCRGYFCFSFGPSRADLAPGGQLHCGCWLGRWLLEWWMGQVVDWEKLVICSGTACTSAAAEPRAPFSAFESVPLAMLDVGAVPFPAF